MSDMLRDSKFVARSVFTHFSTGATCEEVLKLLLQSHERFPEFYPRIDYREVEFWYASFKNKDYDLSQEPTYPENTKLQNLPVFDKIINNINTEDQKALRSVCRSSRNFINKRNRLYGVVHLSITPDSITLKSISEINKEKKMKVFKRVRDGCEIKSDTETRESDMNYMDAAFAEFKAIVAVKDVKIKALTVMHKARGVTAEHHKKFILRIVSTLASLKEKLHVEELKMMIKKPKELIQILKEVKTGSLKKLHFPSRSEVNTPFDMKKVISSTKHWQHLKVLDCSFIVNLQLADISHLEEIDVELNNGVTPEEFLEYKNAILKQQNFDEHEIQLPFELRERTMELVTVMQPFIPVDSDNFNLETIEGKIPWPNQDNTYLKFELDSRIAFERKKK
ncbi:unnamed protein product [Caenorhabditis brenneri]